MSLKSLADNLKSEDEFHTFVKSERVIRRTLSLQHFLQEMSDIIRSHKHEEARRSNVKAYMTDWFLHKKYHPFQQTSEVLFPAEEAYFQLV